MGEALMSGGAGGSGTIYKWKRYELNSKTIYTWDKWSLNSQTVYKWDKWSLNSQTVYKWNKWNAESSYVLSGQAFTGTVQAYTINGKGTDIRTYSSWHIENGIILLAGNVSNADVYPGNSFGTSSANRAFVLNGSSSGNPIYIGNYVSYDAVNGGGAYAPVVCKRKIAAVSNGSTQGSTYYGQVTSTSSSAYPSNGASGSYWYVSAGSEVQHSKGSTSYGQVTSTSSSAYPSNGYSGSYWYVSAGSEVQHSKGSTSYGKVESESSTTYPNGSYSGGYWYDNKSSRIEYSQGAAAGTVYNTNRNAYPDNSYTGSYWYVFDGEA